LKPSYLQNCLGKGVEIVHNVKEYRILEQTWQKEFYRIATSQLPSENFISCDVGHIYGSNGLLDFYINGSLKWMIEIVREGSNLNEHLNRFYPPEVKRKGKRKKSEFGIYDEIERNEWAVIDFRCKSTYIDPYLLDENNLWIVWYNDEFTSATIKRKGKEDLEINFMGDSIPSFSLGSQGKNFVFVVPNI